MSKDKVLTEIPPFRWVIAVCQCYPVVKTDVQKAQRDAAVLSNCVNGCSRRLLGSLGVLQ